MNRIKQTAKQLHELNQEIKRSRKILANLKKEIAKKEGEK